MMMKRFIGVRSIKKQGGVAAIWMGLSLVPIMGFTFWAVEGTRYVQEKSRLGDAAEAAAIAVTMADQEGSANAFATKYVNAYVRDIKSSQVTAKKRHQEAIPDSDTLEFIQYTVDVKTTHDSWFSSTFIPSFNETQDLTAQSIAKKYPAYLGDNNIDIVFVSDFSGSMNNWWGGNYKIYDLKEAVMTVSRKLLCQKIEYDYWLKKEVCKDSDQGELADKLLNRLGIVPYNVRTREVGTDRNVYAVSQLRYKSGFRLVTPERSYEEVDWNAWRNVSARTVYRCKSNRKKCPNKTNEEKAQAKRLARVLGINKNTDSDDYFFVDNKDYVDFSLTVESMLENQFPSNLSKYRVDNVDLYRGYGSPSRNQFATISLTNKTSDIANINSMSAGGNTASFQGILRGIQKLAEGNPNSNDKDEQEDYDNKIKMLLILSDGEESPNNDILDGLVSNGMCDEAREKIPGLYIGVIGIGFTSSNVTEFRECVENPDEDIIDVSNLDELIEKIEELIRKGSRTSGTTKLY
ncbi:pilus assembly protein TadG-related protein [Vibrio sp. ZSDZ65]|uniref:Pilus assembly protein TadG-related protein n=1 Tax=Vibrio qingdaonensis TaxID=2829491 RepID=A0A9X3CJN8_9VIBR|nr:pilus assembly protein TadG-related protein [Vibrio qingdaonensis]MCW8344683.1 pilus assembly protein TadG-related protein [Vibrio qingdaonensis]